VADAPTRRRLDQPKSGRRFSLDIDPETFGRLSENLARFIGTGTFLFWQTLVVIIWIIINLFAVSYRWDPYPFILLNLAFSTQAAYAAPLILLAQNRQDDRDRITLDEDRNRAAQTKADTEFLARELAALRIAIGEVATRDYLRGELDRLRMDLDETSTDPSARGKPAKRLSDKSKASSKGSGGKSGGAGAGARTNEKAEPKTEPKSATQTEPETEGIPNPEQG
jgi:uncharacterized membrane protein